MISLTLDHLPSGKTVAALRATINYSIERGVRPLYLTRQNPSDVINHLRSMEIDCEREDNVIKGTLNGKAWSFSISHES